MSPIAPQARRRAITALLTGLALAPLAGCGGDEAATGASGGDLARLAPATAPLYAQATVRPEGDQGAELDRLIGKVAPGQTLDSLISKASSDAKGKVTFDRDVKPWLGEHAAVVLTGGAAKAGGTPDVAVLIEATDTDKALATIRKSGAKVEDRKYGDTSYLFDAGDDTTNAAGIVDDTLVVATEPAFKAVVDTSKGKGLDTNAAFGKVVDAVSDDALAFVYGDVAKTFEAVRGSLGSADAKQLETFRELVTRQGGKTFAAALEAKADVIKLRAASDAPAGQDLEANAKTLAALPAGSWAAAGLGDLGKALTQGLDALRGISSPGLDVQSGLDQLQQQAGIDVQKDLLAWMGRAGLFVRGTSITDVGGALVVQSKDPGATRAALGKARTILAGAGLRAQDLSGKGITDGFSVRPGNAPFEVFAALAGERFVLAVNRAALDEAIAPAKPLSDDDAFKAAAETLGDGMAPSFYFDFPKVNGLIGAFAGGQPGFDQAKPYLDRIGTIIAGGKREGDLTLQTVTLGVK